MILILKCANNDEVESIYYVKYNEDSFYLVIDDLKGYFKYSEEKELKFIIEDQRKRKIYDQIWDRIKEIISNVYCVLDFVIILEIIVLLDLILMMLYH